MLSVQNCQVNSKGAVPQGKMSWQQGSTGTSLTRAPSHGDPEWSQGVMKAVSGVARYQAGMAHPWCSSTRGQGMISAAALEPKSVGYTHGSLGWSISQFFSHSLAVSMEAWLKVHCSRADPKSCDGTGGRLHKRTEKEGAYRLVRAIRPCCCTQCFDISNICQNVVWVLTKMGNKPKPATSYASSIYLSLEMRENKMSYYDFYFCNKFKYCLSFT